MIELSLVQSLRVLRNSVGDYEQIGQNIRQHKLAYGLILIGFIQGTVLATLLLAWGTGFYYSGKHEMLFAKNALHFWLQETSKPYHGLPSGRKIVLRSQDIIEIPKNLPTVKLAMPALAQLVSLQVAEQKLQIAIEAVNEKFNEIYRLPIVSGGRFIDLLDIKQHRHVIFLGRKIKHQFNNIRIGQKILINDLPFTVIGWVDDANNNQSSYDYADFFAYIPYTTGISLWGEQRVNNFILQAVDGQNLDSFKSQVISYFATKYHFAKDDLQVLLVNDEARFSQFMVWFFVIIYAFLILCAMLTLIVSGIGVANLLYLIIDERAAELGLRVVLGARPTQLLWQVMLEACVIIVMGCGIGLTLVTLLIALLQQTLPSWLAAPKLSINIILLIFFVNASIAILAGFMPAKKAAKLQPATSLIQWS